MEYCALCRQSNIDKKISLKGGSFVCVKCLSKKESELNQIQVKISEYQNMKAPKNAWDFIGYGVIALVISVSIYLLFYIRHYPFNFYIFLLLGFAGISLYHLISEQSDKKKEPFRKIIKSKISEIKTEENLIKDQLSSIYDLFEGRPPDWEMRRLQVIQRDQGRCRKCGRRISGSRVPFHVHHVIPKSKEEGDHRLENLTLLCEICHSKMDQQGHQLIGGARRKRVERKRLYKRKREDMNLG